MARRPELAALQGLKARLTRFTHLRTRLTVLYAGLFGAVLLLVSLSVYLAIGQAAQRQVRSELTATGTVFDRVWSLRSDRLREGSSLLSRDFGFREAVATRDDPTIVSAMENLKQRFEIDRAFIVTAEGRVIGDDAGAIAADARLLAKALDNAEDPSGVVVLGGAPYQIMAAPVLSPDQIGWLVFAVRLDRGEMTALEKLSAIPLNAAVLSRDAPNLKSGGWRQEGRVSAHDRARLSAFIDQAIARKITTPQSIDAGDGAALALVKPLPTLTKTQPAVLVLRYPLARAMAPYQLMLAMVALAGLAGLGVVAWGSWALARGITRPISALDEAVHRLKRGEEAQVEIETEDEIGRLAGSFNTMATEIRDRERRITHLALHDGDTGLPNRLALERVVEALSDLPPGQVYVAALGVHRFDHLRGAIGYALAAQAMRMIGNRLAGLAPASGVARVASDVLGFVLVAADLKAAEDDAQRLMAELETPLNVGGDAIDLTLHLGLASLQRGAGPGAAIEQANIALDQARGARRRVAFFDAAAYGDPAANLALMSGMLRALEDGAIDLFYQPKFDMRLGKVTGVEALSRWRHPARGMLPPDLFIPMAEETGHIRTLTEWVFKRAIDVQAQLAEAGHVVEMSVNVSGRTLGEPDFADFALAEAQRAAGGLIFEITETAVIENPDLALSMIGRFADAGIKISIDDFGTGLSSLAYLKQIRGHELKIDKSLVEGVTESQRDALIVRSTIDLAHSLGLKVTAEGVETEDCYAILAGMGCDTAQGYLIAKPLPLKELLRFLGEDDVKARRFG
ncbi:putative bifunctional diguanylate cyclase/phosphodiesterase [Phenylobacterium sp.]|uniref:putative bifunctional diguanylate cyclase/phosphodiesterase n=1 Tax=Phenylobacterium sp. TaxID=1871053 RepID=UPI002CFDB635|nr:EAL domain-containing protein [Phenylobacterium sp.]HLZ73951.1 EAL domain-containing protein [Phenylobacterium sp.]